MSNILVTGGSGFVGSTLVQYLVKGEHTVKCAHRKSQKNMSLAKWNDIVVGDINSKTDWIEALEGVEVVVHLAARVHVMNESAVDPLAAFRVVNTYGTEKLARQAIDAGVRRFVYLSSIKVNGEFTKGGLPLLKWMLPLHVIPMLFPSLRLNYRYLLLHEKQTWR